MDEGSGQQQKRDKDRWSKVPAERQRRREDREKRGEERRSGRGFTNVRKSVDKRMLFFKQMRCSNNNGLNSYTQIRLSQKVLYPLRRQHYSNIALINTCDSRLVINQGARAKLMILSQM